ncbi:hypothetical protein L207DRAFT_635367 [Hyaloscypha variabilis F]|uniref:Fungal STAND N-terminal Goodbye domain-containing protein n=1 Tax=Hyaloscypha variabilis (strain UAMH 11265 / GT02V1 / F) TaxID=1149755 RepID=A0A2J6RHF3_HYAVF|nr:hypothetical protein L207DRAFT_635367 [Hyaloscypha variabilis F]
MADSPSPQRVPNPERWVKHYIDNVDQEFHSTMDKYEQQRARQEHESLAKIETLFKAALEKYRQQLGARAGESLPAGPLSECEDLEDLATLVEMAVEDYKNHGGRIRKLTRKIGDYQSALHGLAGLLPTDSKFSAVSGGVKLLLHAAGRRSAQRQKIMDALSSFLEVVADSAESLKQFNEDDQLRKAAEALYVAMLKMIEACIDSLINEPAWTKFRHALIGERPPSLRPQTGEKVDHACAHFDRMQRLFNNKLKALTTKSIAETSSTTKRIETHATETVGPTIQHTETVTVEIHQTTKEIDVEMRRVSSNVETHGDILLNIQEMLSDLLSNNEWQRDAEERKSESTRLLVENYRLGLEHVRSRTPSEVPSEPHHRKWFLWKIIEVDPERCVHTCLDEADSMLHNGQQQRGAVSHVLKMYKDERVRTFLKSAASDAIFVEATIEGQEMSRCSCMSLACAVLLQDMAHHPHVAAIHYFCGAHNGANDPVGGGIGILRVLVGQLLCLQEFDFTFLDQDLRAALDHENPNALFEVFEQLVSQLRIQTLFCVIDAITLFEGAKRKEETDALISELIHVALECSHFVHLKLLVTSTSKSRVVAPKFQQGGRKGVVRLQLDSADEDMPMRAAKLEVARNRVMLSPSPSRSPRPVSPRHSGHFS